ncbi:MAG: hypothetical protein CVV27_18170 [Candidatus Melainabacteria bacterium HGW-Melainabacteria-1]|nr:MAG: hypothetical protein CVV27_18170 [Candidatus Melainabacteria bacterium HGW-Melainabacteria-1]
MDSSASSETEAQRPPLRRVLNKLSGEALMGIKGYGIDPTIVRDVALQIKAVVAQEVATAIVVGGGNPYSNSKPTICKG